METNFKFCVSLTTRSLTGTVIETKVIGEHSLMVN